MSLANPTAELPEDELLPALPRLTVAGHEVDIFEESPLLIEAMVRDIRAAKSRVWLESYIIADDDAGRDVADALIDRAAAGLDVRVMYDSVGCYSTPAAYFQRLERAGVKVHAYRTLRETLSRRSFFRFFNRRNHRKLLVIDERAGYFGGMNIVDQRGLHTVEDAKARRLPPSAGWRDLHVRLAGPQQLELAGAFDRLWQRVHHRRPPRHPWRIDRMLASEGDSISFFDSRPTLRHRRPGRVFVPLIRQARRDITVSMAYFIPTGQVLRELVRARRRGVKVRVIVPGHSDVKLVQYAARYMYEFLLRRRFQIYERKVSMLHSKVMVIDGQWTIVGSCNLDPRSLRLNLEFLGVFHSRAMAAAVKRVCRYEMHNSQRITRADYGKRTWRQRLVDRIAWSFRRWL